MKVLNYKIHTKKRKLQTKIPRLLQSNYFTIESNVDGKVAVKCLTCGEVRKGDVSSTGNFLSHLKRKHPTLMPNVTAFLNDESVSGQNVSGPKRNTIISHLEPVSKDEVRSDFVAEVPKLYIVRLFQVTSGLIDLITDLNLPFSFVEAPSLKNLLEIVGRGKILIPKTRQFMNELGERFVRMKKNLIAELEQQEYVCLTCDVWSSRAFSYLRMTVHFISEN